ncbi:hypothetical protein [Azorhizobium sp. AG788]|uniref:hypothetical protein n=1 Tax=Azorhizobium sp. AG788 TaxID=2183897 RepID=UPI00313881D9
MLIISPRGGAAAGRCVSALPAKTASILLLQYRGHMPVKIPASATTAAHKRRFGCILDLHQTQFHLPRN